MKVNKENFPSLGYDREAWLTEFSMPPYYTFVYKGSNWFVWAACDKFDRFTIERGRPYKYVHYTDDLDTKMLATSSGGPLGVKFMVEYMASLPFNCIDLDRGPEE